MNNIPEFDPFQLMMSKMNSSDITQNHTVISYADEDLLELQEFCKQHNIMGINFKNRNPKAILHMLKQKIGVLDEKKLLFD